MDIHRDQWTQQNKSHYHLCLPCLLDYNQSSRSEHCLLSTVGHARIERRKIIAIREKIINDLIILIKKLQVENHEVVLNIDANESFDSGKGGVAKLISMTKLIDPIACTHGSENIPNTHQRGTKE